MSAIKKPAFVPSESKMEEETKRFNKRALIGSIVIHLFFFLLKLPHLELEHKLHDDPKLEPIEMKMITTAAKNELIKNAMKTPEPEVVVKPVVEDKKLNNGTQTVVKNSDRLGDRNKNKVQDVQKGDPKSKIKTAYKPGTDVRKLPKTSVGTGSAPGKIQAKDDNTGGSGDTYQGTDLSTLTDKMAKNAEKIRRQKANRNAADDGGAGGGTGGGIGNGVGGGVGEGRFTGSTTGTTDIAKVAKNVGSLSGAAKGKIDSSRGFDGLASKGSIMVAGVPIEKIQGTVIDRDAIRRLLRDNIPHFRSCYQREMDVVKNPEGFQGIMNFKFFIGSAGRVNRSEVTSDEITSDSVRDCMRNVLQGIKFPEPKGGGTVEVNQPMNLYPKRI
ncbi:MAG: AgmX/PglI C-terminal domain-containing protein [Bacteriovorax sp.]|jgi:hypothetical protein